MRSGLKYLVVASLIELIRDVRDPVLRVVGLGLGGCERGGEFEIGGN